MIDLGSTDRGDVDIDEMQDQYSSELTQCDENRMTLGYLINLLARLLAQSLKQRNGAEGILPGQFPIVLELINKDGATQRELCDTVRIEQGTMANTLKRMERNEIIERRPCEDDRRQYTIHLTPKGLRLASMAVKNASDVNRVAVAGLDIGAQTQLHQMLHDVLTALEADLADRRATDM